MLGVQPVFNVVLMLDVELAVLFDLHLRVAVHTARRGSTDPSAVDVVDTPWHGQRNSPSPSAFTSQRTGHPRWAQELERTLMLSTSCWRSCSVNPSLFWSMKSGRRLPPNSSPMDPCRPGDLTSCLHESQMAFLTVNSDPSPTPLSSVIFL